MAVSLTGRVVVITGASAGIGKEAALAFAREGASVVAAARRVDRLEALHAEIEARGGTCLMVPTDVGVRAQVDRLLDAAVERFGRVDVWLNNAGYGLLGSVEQTTHEEMEQLWRVNYMGVFDGCRAALRQMRKQGSGHILNVASMAARFPLPLGAGYCATKAAIGALSDALAMELRETGIRVTTLYVGLTETEFGEAQVRKMESRPVSMGPAATARSVAERIVVCVKHPVPVIHFMPVPPLGLAVMDLFPSIWRALAARYLHLRTAGRGAPSEAG